MSVTFADILEDVDQLPLDDQMELIDIVNHRASESRRHDIAKNMNEAEIEFNEGKLKPMSIDDMMKEAMP